MTGTTLKPTDPISALMTPNPVCIDAGASARDLACLLDANGVSGVPVVDTNGCIVGVVSRTDLIRQCVEGPLRSHDGSLLGALYGDAGEHIDEENLGCVADFMNVDPIVAAADERIDVAAARMLDERVHRVAVIDSRLRPIGIATSLDMLRVLLHREGKDSRCAN